MPKGVYERPSAETRFWRLVNQDGPVPADHPELGPCWIWKGSGDRYGLIRVDGKYVGSHRFAYALRMGPIPSGMELDHICHVTKCVNPAHLRPASRVQNERNQRVHKDNKSGFKGVHFQKSRNRWRATIKANGKIHELGRFETPEAAHHAYCEAAKRLHGEFANFG
jgi:hypothetical protein